MNLVSLDSNIVLRLILNDVPDQSAKAAAFVGLTECYITDVVVVECVFVLEKVYKLDRDYIVGLMSMLFKLEKVAVNEVTIKKALNLYRRWKPLSFADCYTLVEAMRTGNELVTFDQTLLKKAGVNAREPK
ncbi:MAG: PIN domain-containing protein [Pyrinomonadaceae bacterium]